MRVCARRSASIKLYHKPRHYYHDIHYTVPLYHVHYSYRYTLLYQYKITLSPPPIPAHHYGMSCATALSYRRYGAALCCHGISGAVRDGKGGKGRDGRVLCPDPRSLVMARASLVMA
jgi:hypothetical protein